MLKLSKIGLQHVNLPKPHTKSGMNNRNSNLF